ncbi:MAG TPA: cytochrome c biogenesis CcdA family protein [Dermatophilaceae bacterium]|nr:cytochrome c biogenesis CcdA family protein [Dermatophilaceae bacterium]
MTTVTLPLAALAGVVSFASPCFLPVVPAVLGAVLGDAGSARDSRRRSATRTLAFVGGFTVVFVAMWASLGTIGALLGAHRPTLRILGGAVLVVIGLHVAGLVHLPVLDRQARALERVLRTRSTVRTGAALQTGSGAGPGSVPHAPSHARALLLGLAFAAGWTPCIGPILGTVIGVAAAGDDVLAGTALLLAYAAGLGGPLVLVAVGADSVRRRLGALRRHQRLVSAATGAAIALTGLALIADLLGRVGGLLPTLVV